MAWHPYWPGNTSRVQFGEWLPGVADPPTARPIRPRLNANNVHLDAMFQELAEIEQELEAVEVENVRQLYLSSKPVYEKRAQVIAQIPGFWSAVFQNAPTDIETYIQGDVDASALQHLTSLEVSRFELDDDPQNGEPRSLQFIFRFEMNDFFEDQVLVKKFWHRRSKAGWSGLVSEPVRIRRKKGRDLTNGLLDLAVEVHEQEQSMQNKSLAPSKDKAQTQPTKARQQLMVKLEEWPSFERSVFTWFGFRGKHLSADESSRIIEDDEKPSAQSIAGEVEAKESNLETNNDQALPSYSALNEGHVSSIEIFSPGEEFAVSLSEDLYPEATKYFALFTEEDESDQELDSDDSDSSEEELGHPSKRVKSAR